jgi:hypothetical protein
MKNIVSGLRRWGVETLLDLMLLDSVSGPELEDATMLHELFLPLHCH